MDPDIKYNFKRKNEYLNIKTKYKNTKKRLVDKQKVNMPQTPVDEHLQINKHPSSAVRRKLNFDSKDYKATDVPATEVPNVVLLTTMLHLHTMNK